jgi:hypothetical protein
MSLIPLSSLDSALFNGVKTLTCFLEKVSNLKARAWDSVNVRVLVLCRSVPKILTFFRGLVISFQSLRSKDTGSLFEF